jgi:hypothetical protein
LGKPLATLSGPADLFPVEKRFVARDDRPLWQGPDDLNAKVHLVTDGEALGLVAEVTDNRHVNTQSGGTLWNGDALQLGLVNAKGVHWNIVLALTANGIAFHQSDGPSDALAKAADCTVVRDEQAKVTRYALRLPLATLGMEAGAELGLNIVFHDDDGTGHRHWLQLAPGLARRGNTALYPRFVLGLQKGIRHDSRTQ